MPKEAESKASTRNREKVIDPAPEPHAHARVSDTQLMAQRLLSQQPDQEVSSWPIAGSREDLISAHSASSSSIGSSPPLNPIGSSFLSKTETRPDSVTHTTFVKPALHTLLNAYDFEAVAARTFSAPAWAFYASAATDLVTHRANADLWRQIYLRPRVLRDVRQVSTRRRILGCDSAVPFFVSPCALARLVCDDGEKAWARNCADKGMLQVISSNSSYPLADMLAAAPQQQFFFQLYVNADRTKTAATLKTIRTRHAHQIRAVFLTVDAPVTDKREADERVTAALAASSDLARSSDSATPQTPTGIGNQTGAYIDKALTWEDLAWIRSQVGPDIALVLKGIQTAADARLALAAGMQGIVLSNHGGRALDTASPAVLVLLELHRHAPEVFAQMDVFVDGGIRRGTDIVKALALGATAVGVGRPYLYALAYGQGGAGRLTDS